MVEQPRLIRTGRAMAVATLVSRITGFVRTLALVAALGLGTRLGVTARQRTSGRACARRSRSSASKPSRRVRRPYSKVCTGAAL
ncbi:hypothetical protein GCM10023194_80390 [Planotetraspora phitsanulokensis]|uniref:Uncharacterized protein n=1 Tax=Planotetraspora phitsanulokensis TaxID=575192 RepID=A0A8J3XH61_9ACTN|nr:hypothetical protein Pph01_66350 [Planotetraspora phitsanulokensis]